MCPWPCYASRVCAVFPVCNRVCACVCECNRAVRVCRPGASVWNTVPCCTDVSMSCPVFFSNVGTGNGPPSLGHCMRREKALDTVRKMVAHGTKFMSQVHAQDANRKVESPAPPPVKAEPPHPVDDQCSPTQDPDGQTLVPNCPASSGQVKATSFDTDTAFGPAQYQCCTAPAAATRLTAMPRSVLLRLQESAARCTRATAATLLGDMLRGALTRSNEEIARRRNSSATKRGRSRSRPRAFSAKPDPARGPPVTRSCSRSCVSSSPKLCLSGDMDVSPETQPCKPTVPAASRYPGFSYIDYIAAKNQMLLDNAFQDQQDMKNRFHEFGIRAEEARKKSLRKTDDDAETSKVSSIAWADFVDQSMTPPPEPTHRKVPGGRRFRRDQS